MKKLILALLALAMPYIHYGQIIQNGDFSQNSGNNDPTTACPSFTNGSVPGWSKTHGTPQFTRCGNINNIYLSNDNTLGGEGIAGTYHFYKNKQYYIWLGLCAWNGDFTQSAIKIRATQNLPSNLNPTSCQTSIPTNMGNNEQIASINTYSTPAIGTLVSLLFTPLNNSYDYIWLYPQANNNLGCDMFVNYLFVTRGCVDNLYLSNNDATGYIIPDPDEGFYYKAYKNIYAGSSLGSGTAPVNANPIATTILEARDVVDLLPNFTATPSGNGSFTAQINQSTCGNIPGYTDFPVPTQNIMVQQPQGATARKSNTDDNITDNTDLFSVYPNPVYATVVIQTPVSEIQGLTSISVTTILGQVIYKNEYQQNRIELDMSRYAPGTYLVTVKSVTGTKVFKIEKK